jgi:hypothetical protein
MVDQALSLGCSPGRVRLKNPWHVQRRHNRLNRRHGIPLLMVAALTLSWATSVPRRNPRGTCLGPACLHPLPPGSIPVRMAAHTLAPPGTMGSSARCRGRRSATAWQRSRTAVLTARSESAAAGCALKATPCTAEDVQFSLTDIRGGATVRTNVQRVEVVAPLTVRPPEEPWPDTDFLWHKRHCCRAHRTKNLEQVVMMVSKASHWSGAL